VPGARQDEYLRPAIISEFDSADQEASHSAWLRAKVAASLADEWPGIPHDEVMAEIEAIIEAVETTTHRKS